MNSSDNSSQFKFDTINIVLKETDGQLYTFTKKDNSEKLEKEKVYLDKNCNFFMVYKPKFKKGLQQVAPRKSLYKFIDNKEADVIFFGKDFERDVVLVKYLNRELGKKERNEFEKEYSKIFKNNVKVTLLIDSGSDEQLKKDKKLNVYYKRFVETCQFLYFGSLLEADVFFTSIMDIAKDHLLFLKQSIIEEFEPEEDDFTSFMFTETFEEKTERILEYFKEEDFYNDVLFIKNAFYDFSYDTIYNFIAGAVIFMYLGIGNQISVKPIHYEENKYESLVKWIYDKETIEKITNS